MSDSLMKSVCIIGAGALGLVALKNLLEEGFEATAYERNDHIGGLWHASAVPTQTTALSGTVANASKYTGCYSDFAFSDDTDLHPTAKDVQEYLESYATNFGLWQCIKLSTSVIKIERDAGRRKWVVTSSSADNKIHTVAVDRLILATGSNSKPVVARIQNAEAFEGDILHSQQFKDPSKYAERTVIVVGGGQTAADTVEFLRVAGAKKLYLSHRRSFMILPRMLAGRPIESIVTRRFLVNGAHERTKDATAANETAEQNLHVLREVAWPALKGNVAFAGSREKPLMHASLPVVCDSIADNLISGAVESVQAIDRIAGANSVLLKDETAIRDVDAIIICSGNDFDFSSLLPREFDPSNPDLAPEHFDGIRTAKHYHPGLAVPRAYRRFLSMQEPHSLAFLGHAVSKTTLGLFPFYDLISMTLAQLWKGAITMPTKADMEQECEKYFASLAEMLDKSEISHTGIVQELKSDDWLHETAGTGVPKRLGGGGWDEWRLWLMDRKLYSMLMDGVNSPHVMRLFRTGKRQAWDGAQGAIEKANRDIDEGAEKWKQTGCGPESKVVV